MRVGVEFPDAGECSWRIDTYRNYGYFQVHDADGLNKKASLTPAPHAHEIPRRFVQRYWYLNS